MSERQLTRRALLASGLSLCGLAPAVRLEPLPESTLASAAVRLARDAAEVGRRYLAQHRAEADREVLVDLVGERLDPSAGRLPEQIAASIRADFRDGGVVFVDGWLLSHTEARLCALAHLAAREA